MSFFPFLFVEQSLYHNESLDLMVHRWSKLEKVSHSRMQCWILIRSFPSTSVPFLYPIVISTRLFWLTNLWLVVLILFLEIILLGLWLSLQKIRSVLSSEIFFIIIWHCRSQLKNVDSSGIWTRTFGIPVRRSTCWAIKRTRYSRDKLTLIHDRMCSFRFYFILRMILK